MTIEKLSKQGASAFWLQPVSVQRGKLLTPCRPVHVFRLRRSSARKDRLTSFSGVPPYCAIRLKKLRVDEDAQWAEVAKKSRAAWMEENDF